MLVVSQHGRVGSKAILRQNPPPAYRLTEVVLYNGRKMVPAVSVLVVVMDIGFTVAGPAGEFCMQAGIDSCDTTAASSSSFSGVAATMHQSRFVPLRLPH